MIVFRYDQTFDGFLTVIFETFRRRLRPDALVGPEDQIPLLALEVLELPTEAASAERVWKGLGKKLSGLARRQVMYAWLTEGEGPLLALRYVLAVYSGVAETNFGHPAVLAVRQAAQKIAQAKERLLQFVRFQKTAEGLYFAAIVPDYNVLPLVLEHFADRFADQKWIIYDLKRGYGFACDQDGLREIDYYRPVDPASGRLAEADLAEDEMILQQAWQTYYNSVNIPERANLRQQLGYMPRRYWAYLTEKQGIGEGDG
jgi:probable DNA metabolism protein